MDLFVSLEEMYNGNFIEVRKLLQVDLCTIIVHWTNFSYDEHCIKFSVIVFEQKSLTHLQMFLIH